MQYVQVVHETSDHLKNMDREILSIADECRCKLRTLSIGSEIFNDENSILQPSCNSSIQEHGELCAIIVRACELLFYSVVLFLTLVG